MYLVHGLHPDLLGSLVSAYSVPHMIPSRIRIKDIFFTNFNYHRQSSMMCRMR